MTDTNMQKELNDKMFRTLLDDRLSSKIKANVIEHCIDKGADINARSEDGAYTVLMLASYYGYKEVMETLINNGADINARSYDGKTALIMGAYGSAGKDGVKMLIEQGVDLGVKTPDGRTAEDWARDWGREEVAEVLKRHAESKQNKGVMSKFIGPREGR
ncbi:MAG: ankyrin repeat domain-containing protein [Alphaproteobacteria bacterium]|nr:ankyrin repeat domain-containing protein [Alphaproteobacteria bacterium]